MTENKQWYRVNAAEGPIFKFITKLFQDMLLKDMD